MIIALILAVALFLLAIASHLAILGVGHRLLGRRRDTLAKLGVSLLVLSSHFLVAILFAVGFWLIGSFVCYSFAALDAFVKADAATIAPPLRASAPYLRFVCLGLGRLVNLHAHRERESA